MTLNPDIRLLNCSAAELIPLLGPGSVDLLAVDPPWQYHDSGKKNDKLRGQAAAHYECMTDRDIAEAIAAFAPFMADDTYLALWATFPKLAEWFDASRSILSDASFEYLTGGAWGKVDPAWGGKLGAGHHVRGDAELLLLYRHGKPKARITMSNWWVAPRKGHSEKPQTVLQEIVALSTEAGGLVVDPFAGSSASMAFACRTLGRRYLGAELDTERHREAVLRLTQQHMDLVSVA